MFQFISNKNKLISSVLITAILSIVLVILHSEFETEIVHPDAVIEISLLTGQRLIEVCTENTDNLIYLINRFSFIFISVSIVISFDSLKKYLDPEEELNKEDSREKIVRCVKTEEIYV